MRITKESTKTNQLNAPFRSNIQQLTSRGLPILLMQGILLVLLCSLAYGDTFTVTKTADTNDGVCNSDCSLREAIAATNPSFVDAFDPNPNDRVMALALQPDGKIVIGGAFTSVGGTAIGRVARLNSDGTLDTSFSTNVDGDIYGLEIQPDGKIVIGGLFANVNGSSREGLARLNSDGTTDTSFNPSVSGFVFGIGLQPDGKILIGQFSQHKRFNADGSDDTSFTNGTNNGSTKVFAFQTDGKILIGGSFSQFNGQPRNNVARVNSDGTLDSSYDPDFNSDFSNNANAFALQPDGKLLAGGNLGRIGTHSTPSIGRINVDGSPDTSFTNFQSFGTTLAIEIQADGKILVGYPSTLVRLNPDGSNDTTFANVSVGVDDILIETPNKILVGDNFFTVNGISRNYVARLNLPGPQVHTIEFDPTVFNSQQTITLNGNELFIETGTVVINGPGPQLLTIDANQSSRGFFVNTNADATIKGMTVTNGVGVGGDPGFGGGIANRGILTLDNCLIDNNTASNGGGGILNELGTVLINNSTISNNTATNFGGGIRNNIGSLTITNSTFDNNSATGGSGQGGSIQSFESDIVITDSTITNSTAIFAAGLFLQGTETTPGSASITGATISGNSALTSIGGGIYLVNSAMSINNSEIIANNALNSGGGIYSFSSDLIIDKSNVLANTSQFSGSGLVNVKSTGDLSPGGTMTITDSTISGNSGAGGATNSGSLAVLDISNSTVFENSSDFGAGGIGNSNGTLDLLNVTVARNTAGANFDGNGDGGGVFNGGTANVRNSLIADNIDHAGIAPDFSGTLNSQGYNLIEDTTGTTIAGDTTGNIIGTDPQLDPNGLQDNGLTTKTIALQPGSPAIEAADLGTFPPIDQRGVTRPVDADSSGTAQPDIGAFEATVCAYSLSASSTTAVAGGMNLTVDVTTNAGCTWTVTSNDPWLAVTSSSNGTGADTVDIAVATNSGAARSGTVTIAGQVFTINQNAGTGCSYSINPASTTVSASGGSGTVNITATPGCDWIATSNNSWITVDSGASGTGDGSLNYTIGLTAGTARTGAITIAGQTFTVNQNSGCTYSFTPSTVNVSAAAGNSSFMIGTDSSCGWTASTSDSWITLTSASGTGPANFSFSVEVNPGLPRSGSILINGTPVPVEQDTTLPQTFTVNKTADTNDGICDGDCSLREALAMANAAGGDDTIEFNFAPLTGSQTITLSGTELLIADNGSLVINGTGSGNLTIDANQASRALFVEANAVVTISGVTIINGNGAGAGPVGGGGVSNTGDLTLNDSVVELNSSTSGGGGIHSLIDASLELNNTSVRSNSAGFGGGISAEAGSTLTVNDSKIENNQTTGGTGGGIDAFGDAVIIVDSSSISGNSSGLGGGIEIDFGSSLTLTASTINGNSSPFGGGISFASDAPSSISNSTISSNTTTGFGGGILNFGGALVTISSSTISGNESDSDSDGAGTGGGIDNSFGTVAIDLKNTIVANNVDNTGTAPDISGAVNSQGYNLIEDVTGSTISGVLTGNILGVDPQLDTNGLQDNGGPTNTIALLSTSVAIDTANPADFPATDQRGISRPFDGDGSGTAEPDIGAFELSCTYALSSTSTTATAAGGTGSVNITTSTGCDWTAVSNDSWITVTAGSTGSGNGTVDFSVDANPGPARSGTITIGGETFTINQDAGCAYALSATSTTATAAGGADAVNVITDAGCPWTAASNDSWITVTGGASGSGNGTVDFTVDANTGPARSGSITIAGENFTINQNSGCTYSLSSSSTTVPAAGDTGAVDVVSAAGCAWTAVSNDSWITVTGGASGAGNGTVDFVVDANTGAARIGTVTIAGEVFTVNQDIAPPIGDQAILFSSDRVGNSEIYKMEADGANQQRLTNSAEDEFNAKWAPNGRKILFTRTIDATSRQLLTMDPDGGNELLVSDATGVHRSFAWSPNGQKILYSLPDASGNSQLWTMNADGTGKTNITTSTLQVLQADWSDDGNRIAFSFCDATFTCDIWTMNSDGSTQINVTSANPNDDDLPQWTPDGRIVFGSVDDLGNFDAYIMNADGTNKTPLTNSGAHQIGSISPDGMKLGLTFRGGPTTVWEISTVNLDGTGFTDLTNNSVLDLFELWSPDSSKIAFRSRRDVTTGEIYTMNADGTGVIRLTNNNANDFVSDWRAPVTQPNTRFDFDGDGRTDVSVFRPSVGEWWYNRSSDGITTAFQFGQSTDIPTPGDFTGDGVSDIAFFRPNTGQWFVLRSEDSSFFGFDFGQAGDIPAPGDFDGDGISDGAVFRPAANSWFVLRSSDGTAPAIPFGNNGDWPLVGDYDGDGSDDIAIYRPSLAEYWILRSTAGLTAYQFGAPGDRAFAADFTGDGTADAGFFRPSTGTWFILRSDDASFFAFPFGNPDDIPAPGDYDGDGITDPTVFRPGLATWYSQQSTNGIVITPFGSASDVPVPSVYVSP